MIRLLAQEKHYCGYWKNGGDRNARGKVLALAMGTLVAKPLLATNMYVATIFFQHNSTRGKSLLAIELHMTSYYIFHKSTHN